MIMSQFTNKNPEQSGYRPIMKHKGFTLIEVLVVLMIIGLMAAIVFPRMGQRAEKAKVAQCRIQMKAFASALENYYFDNSCYPSTQQGLEALVKLPATGRIPANWSTGGYLDTNFLPNDPWNTPYIYLSPASSGKRYDIISYGADGTSGGEGLHKDLSVWDVVQP